MKTNASQFLENSFLSPLLEVEGVTDISYNGESLYYVSNKWGRKKSEISVERTQVADFLRQIANISERQFSYSYPILDVSFGRYRLNAVNSSLARNRNEKSYTFSLRLEKEESILDKYPEFFGKNGKGLLLALLENKESIVIGGQTSSGKTELEKWLLSKMPEATRVIVIDNVEELDLIKNPRIDLSTWLVNEQIKGASFPELIRNALRNNPDYIMVAEARGKEMYDALISAMSGHPIITTLHSLDVQSLPSRMARLAMLSSERLYREEIMDDIVHHFRYFVYVAKKTMPDGSIFRHIESISYYDPETRTMTELLEK